ncbi:HNH endonuclease domain-containing protein [Mucilaginibacter sp. 5C4]|uniref:HNH endonuclease domain-containing protein n=1 Tax=Mucilaginibacter sp. 5C4 TaxID=3048589 RepID=UPI002AC94745|nr:HNH endonuclease domain-containing protein [Mucilaginibacter sp. 5C4]MEB0301557.1 HNH endonuclease domain-containing protein [Mucilaginibacter sp. 5C4]WPX25318.1 HNH endonuclease domain-containing protein [Mucilaginibacter sp. 5C4]
MNLPYQEELPIHLLAACFNKTSATYKFYWFLSILGRAELGETKINKNDLFAEMVAHSWFTVNYFHVSFGKQDKLQQAIEKIKWGENLTVDADRGSIFKRLSTTNNKNTIKELRYFNSEVPHRFLSPWFRADDLNSAHEYSQAYLNNCPYSLHKDYIEINPNWAEYFKRNTRLLKDFCYWNLAMYLQTKNPNVPDIPNKLIRSPIRKNLNEQRKFWDIVIEELGSVNCIYTNSRIEKGHYAVEHFIPYAFVSHDLIWNLIPANPSFNSYKSDKLPPLDKYFEPFYKLQQSAMEIILDKSPKNKLLQDYLTIFPSLDLKHINQQKFLEQFQPMITIASNNGFEFFKV